MTTIKIYNNAIIGEGHSTPNICSELSFGFYIILCLMFHKKIIKEYHFKTGTGYSFLIGEVCKETNEIIESYYRSLKEWTNAYNSTQVKVLRIEKNYEEEE
jgi:hypothetical protein